MHEIKVSINGFGINQMTFDLLLYTLLLVQCVHLMKICSSMSMYIQVHTHSTTLNFPLALCSVSPESWVMRIILEIFPKRMKMIYAWRKKENKWTRRRKKQTTQFRSCRTKHKAWTETVLLTPTIQYCNHSSNILLLSSRIWY